jgi:isopenicillin-N epimerase
MEFPALKSQFLLNPDITYLNFGSFGACAKPVFEDYQRWQRELESEPVQFMTVTGLNYLQKSREALGEYIHCSPEDLVFVTNPSYGVNIIAKSLDLKPGDEILSTDIEYGACDRTWRYYCRKAGAKYVRQPITLPVVSKEKIIEDFFKGLSDRTRAIFLSQITSSTALRLPAEEICALSREKGILTIVDGAHVPGHIPLDLSTLQADIFIGACHKWMMTPKSSSFLYVKNELQDLFDPLLISWGYESASPSHSRFQDYHQGQGTRDFSAFLTVPRSIQFMKENDWPSVAAACRKVVRENAMRFCNLLHTAPLCPLTDQFLGQMFSIPVKTKNPEQLKSYLFDQYRIEVPVMPQDGRIYIRYSINAFNTQQDLDRLYDALKDILNKGLFLELERKPDLEHVQG